MLFNSMHFLIFFPIVTLIYFIIPQKVKWIWLLIASYYFYMSWNPWYAILIFLSTFITYMSGILIENTSKILNHSKQISMKKIWVALSFISNLSILFFFKYFDFAITNINRGMAGLGFTLLEPAFDVILPVGISFYTFQALSYTIDIYRGELSAERNLGKYALFVSFFPQLVAGPIERSTNLIKQINSQHKFEYTRVKNGLLRMLWGFFEKLVIADRASILVDNVYNNYQSFSGMQLVVATILFGIQIYCDFASYTDIAIGAAQIMGFELMENFKQPYFAVTVRDFWRRWHISLSSWFRDYLYIPLGGSRCSNLKKYRNLMVTFLMSGLWHGASWNYVAWGGLHGVFQILGEFTASTREKIENKFRIKASTLYQFCKIGVTFLLIHFAWIFFRAESFMTALRFIKRIFLDFGFSNLLGGKLYQLGLSKSNLTILVVSIIILFLYDLINQKKNVIIEISKKNGMIRWMIYYALVLYKSIQLWLTGKGNIETQGTQYSRGQFNEYGDNIFNRPRTYITPTKFGARFAGLLPFPEVIDYWNSYNEFVTSKNATLYISSPPILADNFEADLEGLQKALASDLDCEVISSFEDYLYPIDYFYDTGFHLNNVGVPIRTQQLIDDLRASSVFDK